MLRRWRCLMKCVSLARKRAATGEEPGVLAFRNAGERSKDKDVGQYEARCVRGVDVQGLPRRRLATTEPRDRWKEMPVGSVHCTSLTGACRRRLHCEGKSFAVLEEPTNLAGRDPCGRLRSTDQVIRTQEPKVGGCDKVSRGDRAKPLAPLLIEPSGRGRGQGLVFGAVSRLI